MVGFIYFHANYLMIRGGQKLRDCGRFQQRLYDDFVIIYFMKLCLYSYFRARRVLGVQEAKKVSRAFQAPKDCQDQKDRKENRVNRVPEAQKEIE